MAERTLEMLWVSTEHGRLPVICDASSCTEGLMTMRNSVAGSPYQALRFVDSVEFIAEMALPELSITYPIGSIMLHPTCSSLQLGINDSFSAVADFLADEVTIPDSWGCCAYAGDRGMLHPELTASATQEETIEVLTANVDAYASLNRTCEQGMTEATGKPYLHILQHLEAASRPVTQIAP